MSFQIHRGTNISHWLSQSDARGAERKARFTRDDCRRLADIGLDHLRLPVDEEQMWTESGDRDPEAWDLLNQALDGCERDGMSAIVDLHILRCHHFNSEHGKNSLFADPASSERFVECWRDLSKELSSRSCDRVAYELMNEPVADDPEDWNRVLRLPYAAIRETEPDRVIAVGSNSWSSPDTFADFDPPADDPNIILVFHYYKPMLITHHAAPWSRKTRDYHGPIRYPGVPVPAENLNGLEPDLREIIESGNQPFDIHAMERSLSPVIEKMKATGLPAWCNEFGVYREAPDAVRERWYGDFLTVLNRHGIPWTNWDFRGGFGLYDSENQPTVVLSALMNR